MGLYKLKREWMFLVHTLFMKASMAGGIQRVMLVIFIDRRKQRSA
jgi:hypothetical protein